MGDSQHMFLPNEKKKDGKGIRSVATFTATSTGGGGIFLKMLEKIIRTGAGVSPYSAENAPEKKKALQGERLHRLW